MPALAACALALLQAATPPQDALVLPPLAGVRLTGWLGARVRANAEHRLLELDEDVLLGGFEHRPGAQAWIGEHVGKFLHAATLAWANGHDPRLRKKLDRVVARFLATQEADGYLGTYLEDRRFGLFDGADWDVWVHKYAILGLLAYAEHTGDAAALAAARRAADLLLATFGPGHRSLIGAGTHVGMAATSVLEPMVLLHRATGEPRYLDFARWIVAEWDAPGGPRIASSLQSGNGVEGTANAKAYEMLSNLVGLCELVRTTGERDLLAPVLAAFEDVVAHHLYLTGSASRGERFGADFELPNAESAAVGETCVTVTWLQLDAQLLRLTGQARFGDELERTLYNHLAAAQHEDGSRWCYFTSLDGGKPYSHEIHCCGSSGPRGLALAPSLSMLTAGERTLVINLFDTTEARLRLDGQDVVATLESEFPRRGQARLHLHMTRPATLAVFVRAPAWAQPVELPGASIVGSPHDGRWAVLPERRYAPGAEVAFTFNLAVTMAAGAHGNAGHAAWCYGPFVLAWDSALNRRTQAPPWLAWGPAAPERLGQQLASVAAVPLVFAAGVRTPERDTALLLPFADAGASGGVYRVWLPAAEVPAPAEPPPRERRSRSGNRAGSIADGDPNTYVVTFDDHPAEADWFAVEYDVPRPVVAVTFHHGHCFHDGGWFDTSDGPPRVEGRLDAGTAWRTLGVLADYPATSARDPAGLVDGQAFTLQLPAPLDLLAVRVVGRPASGDRPAQAFASCGELSVETR